MKLAPLRPAGHERPYVLAEDGFYSIETLTADIDGRLLEAEDPGRVVAALAAGKLPRVDGADRLAVVSPVSRPGSVVCIGVNYAAHAEESGAAPPIPDQRRTAPGTTTADQIFAVGYLIHHLSQLMCLDPGEVVLTGTPEGVALSGRFRICVPVTSSRSKSTASACS